MKWSAISSETYGRSISTQPFLFLLAYLQETSGCLIPITHLFLAFFQERLILRTSQDVVIVKNYLFYRLKSIIIPVRRSLWLLVITRRRHRMGGWDANSLLRKELLQVTRGYIVVIITCVYVLMYKKVCFKEILNRMCLGFQ